MTQPPAYKRPALQWVDWIKVIALLGVISIHNAGPNAGDAKAGNHRLANLLGVAIDIPFIVAVPLFVMVSGTLLLNPDAFRGTGDFLRKRVVRLLPAIVVWNLFYVAFMQFYMEAPRPWAQVMQRFLNGQTVAHMYYLWIILGLSLLSPVLIRWLRDASPTEQAWVAAGLALIPPLTIGTATVRGSAGLLVQTPWTWWFGYLGLFLLGWVLRDVVVTGWRLLLMALAVAALLVEQCVQFINPTMPVLGTISPVHYYGITVVVAAVGSFVVLRSSFRAGGPLGFLLAPALMRPVSTLAKISLGVFALHMAVLLVLVKLEVFGPGKTDGGLLLARYVVGTLITIALVLVMRRIPGLRRLV